MEKEKTNQSDHSDQTYHAYRKPSEHGPFSSCSNSDTSRLQLLRCCGIPKLLGIQINHADANAMFHFTLAEFMQVRLPVRGKALGPVHEQHRRPLSYPVCEGSFLSAILLWLASAPKDISLIGGGLDPWLKLLRVLGWVMVIGIIFLVVAAGWFWKARGLGWWTRTHATLLALGGVAFGLFAWHWHLLDASLKF